MKNKVTLCTNKIRKMTINLNMLWDVITSSLIFWISPWCLLFSLKLHWSSVPKCGKYAYIIMPWGRHSNH